jgi:hypothetical protein
MKNKGLTFILLIVVGVIWYKVFFRIKDNLTAEDGTQSTPNEAPIIKMKFVKDTFTVQANYRDPFHSNNSGVSAPTDELVNSTPVVYQAPKTVPEPPKPHRWPKMKYYGIMKSNPEKGTLAIIAIDNMLFNLREGEEAYDGITLRKIYGDSVLMAHGKYGKVLRK